MSTKDEKVCVTLMEFIERLLTNTADMQYYDYLGTINSFLNCPTYKIKYHVLKIMSINAFRTVKAHQSIMTKPPFNDPILRTNLLKVALALPSSVPDDDGDHFSLIDLFTEKKKYPSNWTKLKYPYYIQERRNNKASNSITTSQTTSAINTSTMVLASTPVLSSSSLRKLILNKEDLQKYTLQELYNKGMEVLPHKNWFDYSLKVAVAKSFSDDSEENKELRKLIIKTKFMAIALTNCIFVPPQVSAKFFEVDQYAFNSLTDFISGDEAKLSTDLKLDALFTLNCISSKHIWCSDIMRNIGGNMSHGLLFQILRYLNKNLREEKSEVNELYNGYLFDLITNIAAVKTLHESLVAAGLIPILMEIASVRESKHKKTLTSAARLLTQMIKNTETATEFINNDGFNILINTISYEIEYALNNADKSHTPQYVNASYSISYVQMEYIKSLLLLVLKLLRTDSSDRIRNLIDSPLLVSLMKLLSNKDIFGNAILQYSLDIVQSVINNEPTIYSVLVEAGIIPYIIDNFQEFVAPSADLIILLPDVISALCLNTEGLKKVKERNLVQYLFNCLLDKDCTDILAYYDEGAEYGASIDELARHYPDLKEPIETAFFKLVEKLPEHISFNQSFLFESPIGADYFYHSKDEAVVNHEPDDKTGEALPFWDFQESSAVVECFSSILYGMTLENSPLLDIPKNLDFTKFLPILTPQRPPFDYCQSQTMLNVLDILRLFDDKYPEYGYSTMLDLLDKKLDDIHLFLTYPDESSIFLDIKKGEDYSAIEDMIAMLSEITTITFQLTRVYLSEENMAPNRIIQTINYFKDRGFKLISKLRLLFQRCALEEMYFSRTLPVEANISTQHLSYSHSPPIQVHAAPPKKVARNDYLTSARHKNTLQIRSFIAQLQSFASEMFRCLLKLGQGKVGDIEEHNLSIEFHIFDEVVTEVLKLFSAVPLLNNLQYYLVVLNFNSFIFTFPKSRIMSSDLLQTIPAVLFYQKGGYTLYAEMIQKLFQRMSRIEDVSVVENVNYINTSDDVLNLSCLINCLTFLNKSMQKDSMENIRTMTNFYPFLTKGDCNMTDALIVRIKLLSLSTIMDLDENDLLFTARKHSVPYTVFKQILTMLKNCFSEVNGKGELYEICWDLIHPSDKKINILTKMLPNTDRGNAATYLQSRKGKLPYDQGESYLGEEKLNNLVDWEHISPSPQPPQYNKYTTVEELVQLRENFYNDNLPAKVFNILPYYPKLVNAFARMLLQAFASSKDSEIQFASKILKEILKTNVDEKETLSSYIHIFGIFLNEGDIYQKSNHLITLFLNYLESRLLPEHINTPWFSKALFVYEIVLTKSELPYEEELSTAVILDEYPLDPIHVHRISDNVKQRIFDVLIRVGDINNFYSALATARILIIYAANEKFAKDITNSGILIKLLKVIGTSQKSEKINFLESSFLLLLRRCFETSDIIGELMMYELNKSFSARPLNTKKERERELGTLLEEKAHVAMRSPDRFVEVLERSTQFTNFDEDGTLLDYTIKKRASTENTASSANAKTSAHTLKSTGIIHLLISQLVAVSEKDWISEPEPHDKPKPTLTRTNDVKVDPTRNPICGYMMFLLKTLIELITSYKQCKYEFLTFNKRDKYSEQIRPRTSAMNFFLYKLLERCDDQEDNVYAKKRREVISTLAKSVIVGFVSDVQDSENEDHNPKDADPDLTFIRKFTIETISKALRKCMSSPKLIEVNVNKINAWFNIIHSMVYLHAPYIKLLLDSNKIESDRYQICRLMIDLNIPSTITDCIASLDLNYPFSKKLFNDAVEAINAINSTRIDFAEHFQVENDDADENIEDESDKEEAPNMFRNSALGMYDVEDIEEDDEEDDDSLIGDDGIAFVNDDDDFQIIFTDEEEGRLTDDDNESSSSAESESDAADYSNDGINIVVDQIMTDVSDGESYDVENNNPGIEIVEDEHGISASDLDIELSEYDIDESDWDSRISDISIEYSDDSEEDTDDAMEISAPSANHRRWALTEDIDLIEESSDEEARGVFQGVEHVFNTEPALFRIDTSLQHRHHHRTQRNSALEPPSMTLLNGTRSRYANSLINPLGPSGLEQVENDISTELNTVRSGTESRQERPHFTDTLLSSHLLEDKTLDGVILKSTVARWKDIYDMFYDSRSYSSYLTSRIINRLYHKSLDLWRKDKEHALEVAKKEAEELQRSKNIREEKKLSISPESEHVPESQSNTDSHEPVYVEIEGSTVDIGGTDIDPEFLSALPDDMRAEVFAQHIRERRAEAVHHNIQSREINQDFLDAIPEDIRDDILEHEADESSSSHLTQTHTDGDTNSDSGSTEPIRLHNAVDELDLSRSNTTVPPKEPTRIVYGPLLDKAGIATLMKALFFSQPYMQREIYHELFYRLCCSKQNRNDILNILLFILAEGINDQHSLEKTYTILSVRACGNDKSHSVPTSRQIPTDCSPLVVTTQAIEILQILLERNRSMRFFFITEHENLMVNKPSSKNKKENPAKNEKLPLKHLFSLLDKKIITDETQLMDLLTRIIQICTQRLDKLIKTSAKNRWKKKLQQPDVSRDDIMKLVAIIKLDSCNTKVFQQTLNIMLNLSVFNNNIELLTEQLVLLGKGTTADLLKDLNDLAQESERISDKPELDPDLLIKFTIPNSDQAKLLKILTAIDYVYSHDSTLGADKDEKLIKLYNEMHLGPIWSSLSKCLAKFESSSHFTTSATILLPVIESLMIVCKHTKATHEKVKKYEEGKSLDFAEIPVENLFYPFTDLHKKLLNQMVRSNSQLMSGPFSLLVKNPKILDFDNKRYYFMAKLKTETAEKPKLAVSVRRDQVFLDSYRSLFFKSDDEIKNSRLEITFKGESGVDAGGLTREWYQVLSRQMFNPDYALFLPVSSDKTTFHPNRTSGVNPEHLSFFKFIGMVLGKAIRDQCFLDCHFSRDVYKNMLGKPVSLKDMESIDLDYYKSLVWILENDITDVIEETFSVETDDYGEHKVIDLIENGSNVPVTEENKKDYVKKIVEYKLHTSVKEQMDNFLRGFYSLIPKELVSIFDEQELELLVSGLPDIDVDDWKNNTNYTNYTSNDKQINYFWRAVRSFDVEERARLLQFVTGTSKVPLNGFKELSGVEGVCKFAIHRDYGSTDRLPSSHTCFNQLNLPAYNSYETLRGSLLIAINEGHEGFGLA
ncbi:E3 ubiquitin-protein ligase TOM1 NDAI_0H01870 [Naumovozyma dairenensis CBS 421]|uniref:HECT-type E3 ubiquitin transferase n=1 Tax=Naumovozyma dairenensis (strain ATCC 10597 / BCRC 20456 / CBS 421 / NBRC 0211 / NRRL Y-12639) TaxID=1071378 RepID=G0WF00_NAUDC|nr:hypothetical protein NDAI_0H01870 [Naumovozyma dairenensis CBS 421]CCD26361.1 hypothetical protein NDAI_0H01870 [Naumovozyma dairenensis CBS 421]